MRRPEALRTVVALLRPALESESKGCLWLKYNASGLCRELSRIFSESDATCYGQSTIASYDLALSWFGKR